MKYGTIGFIASILALCTPALFGMVLFPLLFEKDLFLLVLAIMVIFVGVGLTFSWFSLTKKEGVKGLAISGLIISSLELIYLLFIFII